MGSERVCGLLHVTFRHQGGVVERVGEWRNDELRRHPHRELTRSRRDRWRGDYPPLTYGSRHGRCTLRRHTHDTGSRHPCVAPGAGAQRQGTLTQRNEDRIRRFGEMFEFRRHRGQTFGELDMFAIEQQRTADHARVAACLFLHVLRVLRIEADRRPGVSQRLDLGWVSRQRPEQLDVEAVTATGVRHRDTEVARGGADDPIRLRMVDEEPLRSATHHRADRIRGLDLEDHFDSEESGDSFGAELRGADERPRNQLRCLHHSIEIDFEWPRQRNLPVNSQGRQQKPPSRVATVVTGLDRLREADQVGRLGLAGQPPQEGGHLPARHVLIGRIPIPTDTRRDPLVVQPVDRLGVVAISANIAEAGRW